MKEFIEVYGGVSDFSILRESAREHKVLNDEVIDSIPRDERFDAPNVRKAYNESNVEFKSVEATVNYMENRTLEKVAPAIAERLDAIRDSLSGVPLVSPLEPRLPLVALHPLEPQPSRLPRPAKPTDRRH